MFFLFLFILNICFCIFDNSRAMLIHQEDIRDSLTTNVYRIINTAYSFDLPDHMQELDDDNRYGNSRDGKINKFNHAFSFIKKGDGYLIKSLRDDNYLCTSEHNVQYSKLNRKSSSGFIWNINFIANSICKIFPFGSKEFLVVNKIEEGGNKGQKQVFYKLSIKEGTFESNNLGFTADNSEWRLNPFYPSSGYSDFFKIIRDCGDLISLKYATELKAIKTVPTSSHDFDCLSVQCLDKTRICLNTQSPHYKPTIREIFSIEDVFKSTLPSDSPGSVVKVTRVIETEEIFQTTIENSLTTLQREVIAKNEKNISRVAHEEGEDIEKMDQIGFSQSLNTLLSIAITQAIDLSNTTGSRQTTTLGESTQHSSYKDTGASMFTGTMNDTGSSNTHGVSDTQSFGIDTAATAGFKAGFASGSLTVAAHANTTNQTSLNETTTKNTQKSSNITNNTSQGKNLSKQKNKEEANEQFEEQTNRISHSKEAQNQTGKLREERKDQTTTNAKRRVNTKEHTNEQEKLKELGVEQSLNLTEIKSVTQKKNEKWLIEREFIHVPNTALQVKFFEEAIEAIDHPFEVSLHISGRVGFTFEESILIDIHPHRDYLTGSTWFLSPATILSYLKAPGYKINEDGSVNYIVKGKLNLKHPLNIFTVIDQDMLPLHKNNRATANVKTSLASSHDDAITDLARFNVEVSDEEERKHDIAKSNKRKKDEKMEDKKKVKKRKIAE